MTDHDIDDRYPLLPSADDRRVIARNVREVLDQWERDPYTRGPNMIDLDVYDQHGFGSFRYMELGDIFATLADSDNWNSLARQQADGRAQECVAVPPAIAERWHSEVELDI